MNPTDLNVLARWCGAVRSGPLSGIAISGAAIDSRTVKRGDLFFALPGVRRDGHDFLSEAFRRGACAAVVERKASLLPESVRSRPLLRVADAEEALVRLARSYRATLSVLAVAVTGSNGKTTTKNLLGSFLGAAMATLISPQSFNNRLGVSLTILALDRSHRAAVFELGMNHPGEIRSLARLCRPAAGAILNVGPAHLGKLKSLEEIARAKGELISALAGRRLLALNIDDPRVVALARRFSGETVTFGLSPWAQVRAERIELGERSAAFDLVLEGAARRVRSPLPGLHNVYNLLAAAALAERLGVSRAAIRCAVGRLQLPPMRWETGQAGGARIINDAYNANPASMRAALAAFRTLPVAGKRIMVSGDMNELGRFASREHRRWGAELAASGLDRLVFVGPLSRLAAAGAEAAGAGEGVVASCSGRSEALAALRRMVAPGDAVLIKGSRIMALEELADQLSTALPRRGR
jgi:UDP-N-acetylmuramoyl-tripeptide--D-alanyl-D-alanine ligase